MDCAARWHLPVAAVHLVYGRLLSYYSLQVCADFTAQPLPQLSYAAPHAVDEAETQRQQAVDVRYAGAALPQLALSPHLIGPWSAGTAPCRRVILHTHMPGPPHTQAHALLQQPCKAYPRCIQRYLNTCSCLSMLDCMRLSQACQDLGAKATKGLSLRTIRLKDLPAGLRTCELVLQRAGAPQRRGF